MIKDRNSKNVREAEDIKKRWQKYTEELYKKVLMDNYDGVVTNLKPDILECEVKWALGSITKVALLNFTKLVDMKEFQLSYLKF